MSTVAGITSTETRDLFISLIALVMAFSILRERRVPGYEVLLISTLGVSTGFLLHELAHKFVAMHFGYWAEYRANGMGLVLAVVMAFAGVIFAAPGAVMITRVSLPHEFYEQDLIGKEELNRKAKNEQLFISLAGPLTNIVLAAIFFLLLVSGIVGNGIFFQAANFALFINLVLAAFNLLPVGPLDGKKIFDSNRIVWAVVAVPTILIALPVYFGLV